MTLSEEITTDPINLNKAFIKSCASAPDKGAVKRFKLHKLEEIKRAQDELKSRKWKIQVLPPFYEYERGHKRKIVGNTPYDRMILHDYFDNVFMPIIEPHIIKDSYASQIGKGEKLARQRFEDFLHKQYRISGNNKFYIGFWDCAKCYDNIRHDYLWNDIFEYLPNDEFNRYMIRTTLNSFRVDVSWMNDDEYAQCLDTIYVANDHDWCTDGLKYMDKGLNIGSPGAQAFSTLFFGKTDHWLKTVKGIKHTGHYADDYFIIHDSKDYIWNIIREVDELYKKRGMFLSDKKTVVVRADSSFRWLNRIYSVKDKGHVVIKLDDSTLTRERHRIKKFCGLFNDGEKDYKSIETQYKGWSGTFMKFMNKEQRNRMNNLYNELFIDDFIKGGIYVT